MQRGINMNVNECLTRRTPIWPVIPGSWKSLFDWPGSGTLGLIKPVFCLKSPTCQPSSQHPLLLVSTTSYKCLLSPQQAIQTYDHSYGRPSQQWRQRTWTSQIPCPWPPLEFRRSFTGGRSWTCSWPRPPPESPSRPSLPTWTGLLCPAYSSSKVISSPLDGDRWSAPPHSSPKCLRHTAKCQKIWLQSSKWTFSQGFSGAKCTAGHPYTWTLSNIRV